MLGLLFAFAILVLVCYGFWMLAAIAPEPLGRILQILVIIVGGCVAIMLLARLVGVPIPTLP